MAECRLVCVCVCCCRVGRDIWCVVYGCEQVTKTKDMKKLLGSRGWDHALFVGGATIDSRFVLATRNIPHVDTMPQNKINVYSILQKDLLIVTQDAVKYLEERLHLD